MQEITSFSEVLKSRHSVREFKTDHQIPVEELQEIIQLAHTAPSAWNLQHWRTIVIQDSANKEALLSIANNQQQVVDASVVFVILGDIEANKTTEVVYKPLVEEGFMSAEAYEQLTQNIHRAYKGPLSRKRESACTNASLFAMQLMLALKAKGYDSVPMGGFQSDKLIEKLHIPDRYFPIMLIAAGVAAAPAHQTIRLPLEEIIIHESF